MEGDPSSVSHGTKFEFNRRTDRIQQTKGHESINHHSTRDDIRCSRTLPGTVDVDETYVGGQWKNKRKMIREQGTIRGRRTKKQPVFGILCCDDTVQAEVVDGGDAGTLHPHISRKVSTGSIVCSGTWKAYTGIAAR